VNLRDGCGGSITWRERGFKMENGAGTVSFEYHEEAARRDVLHSTY
jgi:hypothetical protein